MERLFYLPIGGTQIRTADGCEWRNRGSEFDLIAVRRGIERVDLDGDPASPDPSIWSRAVNGLMLQQLMGRQRRAWMAGIDPLLKAHALARLAAPDRPIIWVAHSHGGAVACLALATEASEPLRPAALVSLDMPVRRKMRPVYAQMRQRHPALPIIHLHSTGHGWHARFRWMGNRFGPREWNIADQNIPVDGGHSRFLSHAEYLPQWNWIWPRIEQAIGEKK